MLVDHADTKVVCIVGVIDLDFLAVFLDDALLRLVQAKQNAHEGGFAGAVFAQQGMHFAFAQLEGDVVVCLDTGELFGNIQHLNDKIFSQSAHAPFTNQSIGAGLPLYTGKMDLEAPLHSKICAKLPARTAPLIHRRSALVSFIIQFFVGHDK